MARKKFNKAPRFPSAEALFGDGTDPRYDRDPHRRQAPNRKALQLCSQIRDCLNMCFADCGDDFLRELVVESVVPAPDSRQMLVTIAAPKDFETPSVLDHIARASGKLRSEAAAAIHRKRVPRLVFQVAAHNT
jgi:ribosome-binding factor A